MKDILAGITLLTALNLKLSTDDDICITYAKHDDGKFSGWITNPYKYHRPILNTGPIFLTEDAATDHMREVVKACRELDGQLN